MKSFLVVIFGVIFLMACQRPGDGGNDDGAEDQGDAAGQQQNGQEGADDDKGKAAAAGKVIVKAGAVQVSLAAGECASLKQAELSIVSVKPDGKDDVLCSQRVAKDACFASLPTAAGNFEWNASDEKLVATQKTGCKALAAPAPAAAAQQQPAAQTQAPAADAAPAASSNEQQQPSAPAASGG